MTDPLSETDAPGGLAEPGVEELKRQNEELAQALRRLSGLQDQLLTLRTSSTIDLALDAMETVLEDMVEFTYMRLYLRYRVDSPMQMVREMCPQDFQVNWELVEWAVGKQELALLPLEDAAEDAPQSLLIMPLIGHSEQVGVLLLWVEFDMTSFTQERSMLLNLLARETASVIETLRLRRRVEAARAELASVIENIPMGVFAIDAEDRLVLINGTAEFLFALNRNEALGARLGDLLPPGTYAQLKELLQSPPGTEEEIELLISERVGETFGASAAPLRPSTASEDAADGAASSTETQGHVVVFRDLKLSREVAKLRELDAMKNDFLSLVSHELRTPLTSIMAYSETLLMEGMIDSEEERREYLQIIHNEGGRLSRLINDVLDLTKMESGKMEYVYEELDIVDLVQSAGAAVHSLATQKQMHMPVESAEDLPPVRADSDKIMQVLTNLYSNAIKFTDEGGTVGTNIRLVPPGAGEDEKQTMVEVAVSDTGMGIAPEDIHKVFSKFEQIEKIDHHSVGTGLGMPICKQIVEEGHGGRIWIDSELGVGTTVHFCLPLA
jgi:signal transduction histidine kinase